MEHFLLTSSIQNDIRIGAFLLFQGYRILKLRLKLINGLFRPEAAHTHIRTLSGNVFSISFFNNKVNQ